MASGTGGFVLNTHNKRSSPGWRRRRAKDAAILLEALEALRVELGSVGEDIITIMRDAGITPPEKLDAEEGRPGEG